MSLLKEKSVEYSMKKEKFFLLIRGTLRVFDGDYFSFSFSE